MDSGAHVLLTLPSFVKKVGANCIVPHQRDLLSSALQFFCQEAMVPFCQGKAAGLHGMGCAPVVKACCGCVVPFNFCQDKGGALRDKVCVCNLFLGGFAASFVGQLVQLLALFFDLLNQKPSFHQ